MNSMGKQRAIPVAASQTHCLRYRQGLLLLLCLGLPGPLATAASDLLDASSLPEADKALVDEQPSLLEAIRMSIEISLAECEDEGSCDLVRDGEMDTLMMLIDEQVTHLQQQQRDIPEDTFAQYEKLKETYALYRPRLRDINLGISLLSNEEMAQLKKEMENLISILIAYELPLPEADDDSELVLASEANEEQAPAAPGATPAPDAGTDAGTDTDTGTDNPSDNTPVPSPQ